MKILVSITSGSNNTERNILRAFYDGIEKFYFSKFQADTHKILKKQHGVDLRLSYDPEIEKCDVAVQFGTAKDRNAEHHVTKQSIRKNSKVIVYIETPLLGRVIDNKNNYDFYRVGVNGFLNNDGIFYNEEERDTTRLKVLKSKLDIPEFPGWRKHKQGYILMLLQLPGDASLRGQRMSEWLCDTIDQIRSFSDRHIHIRLHPAMSDKGKAEFFSECYPLFFRNYSAISWGDGHTPLRQDILNAGICVSYSSGSSIDSILCGVPVITIDEGNLAYPISSRRIEDIENPKLASKEDIDNWLLSLANSQWDESEMLEGTVWKKIEPIVLQCLLEKNENSDLS